MVPFIVSALKLGVVFVVGLAASCFFRGLAYPSTQQIVGGLNFRVRCGSGWFPAAMAAKTSLMNMTDAIECCVRSIFLNSLF